MSRVESLERYKAAMGYTAVGTEEVLGLATAGSVHWSYPDSGSYPESTEQLMHAAATSCSLTCRHIVTLWSWEADGPLLAGTERRIGGPRGPLCGQWIPAGLGESMLGRMGPDLKNRHMCTP